MGKSQITDCRDHKRINKFSWKTLDEQTILVGRHRRRWKDNIKMDLKCSVRVQIGLHLVQNREPGQVSLKMAINFSVP
jgi:hypothetical protein